MIVQDRRLAFTFRVQFQNASYIRAGAAAGEFAVTERSCSTFTKEVITHRIVRSPIVKRFDITNAFVDRSPAFQHERLITLQGEEICTRQPGRAGTDYHGTMA